jgi:hypothetical protein
MTFRVPALYFIVFLFFPIPKPSVSSVDRPIPKNDGRDKADVLSGPC